MENKSEAARETHAKIEVKGGGTVPLSTPAEHRSIYK